MEIYIKDILKIIREKGKEYGNFFDVGKIIIYK